MSDHESEVNDEDEAEGEPLSEKDQDRIQRVQGKRRNRPSRQRGRSPQQEQQGQQSPQAEQEPQENREDEQNRTAKEPQAQESMETQTSETAEEEQPPQAQQEQQANQAALEPVTQREHDTFYLAEDVRNELNMAYRRVAMNVLEQTGVDIDGQQIGGRNRYFRPLALLLGARELQEMSSEELRDAIEQEDLIDDLPKE